MTALALPAALLLLGCATKASDSADTGPDVYPFEECTPGEGDWPLASGTYTTTIDQALYNNCENASGNGYHIHVGQENPLELSADRNCITADADGMLLAGEIVDNQLSMIGYLDMEHGTCTMRIDATLTATITGESAFDYQVDAVAAPVNGTDDACALMIGDNQYATFPQIPCDYGWTGQAWLAGSSLRSSQ